MSIKKLSHKYEYLKLELEEVKEKNEQFTKEWNDRFGSYFADKQQWAWENTETGEIRFSLEEPPARPKNVQDERVKKLYKKISTKVHPDVGGSSSAFAELKKHFDNNNFIEMIKIASMSDVEVDIDSSDIEYFDNSCRFLEEEITSISNSLMWSFFTGDENKRKLIIAQLIHHHELKIPEEDIPRLLSWNIE